MKTLAEWVYQAARFSQVHQEVGGPAKLVITKLSLVGLGEGKGGRGMVKLKRVLTSGRTGLRPREHKQNLRRLKEKEIFRELRRISRFKRLDYKVWRLIREIREHLGLSFNFFSGDVVALYYILKLRLCTKEELREWWAKKE